MDIVNILACELDVKTSQVQAAVKLIDEGNTIPFIARYRKEMTGSLNDEVLRNLNERLGQLRNLSERMEQAIAALDEQGVLDDELKNRILNASALVEVEDLYRPYRPKKRTRASTAREKGLEGLSDIILAQEITYPVTEAAAAFISDKEGLEVEDEKAAIAGALDIIAEKISDNADFRARIRRDIMRDGTISSQAKDKEETSVYENYYSFEESACRCAGHRILAINRGEKEKVLNVKINAPEDVIINFLERQIIKNNNSFTEPYIKEAVSDSYKRLMQPAIEREIRNELTLRAETGAIRVFGENLKQLLMQPPVKGKVVLGWDPAFRTGCKLAVVDENGKVLETVVIYPTAPQNKTKEAKEVLEKLIKKHNISLISVGNGTASRESEAFIAGFLKELGEDIKYIIVNEAGASVYSAGKLAAEEFPHFDVGARSAVSIARRVQDPLAELVKIDPKSIGVGQYQHDMNQKYLNETLVNVVEDCVNKVGVDLNTASVSLLEYISGINKTIARNIVSYREENGGFKTRKQLLKVPKLGPKSFEQCAGFLRISSGDEPLDFTSVHPESYAAAKELLKILGYELSQLKHGGVKGISKKIVDYKKISKELGIGEVTLADIADELEKPARDPRDEMPKPILRTDVLSIDDLKEGMILKGTVRNVIDFGAFIDIGVHQDGLVHISQMSDKYIKHPLEVLSIGDIIEVKVIKIDAAKKRIGLTMLF